MALPGGFLLDPARSRLCCESRKDSKYNAPDLQARTGCYRLDGLCFEKASPGRSVAGITIMEKRRSPWVAAGGFHAFPWLFGLIFYCPAVSSMQVR